MLTTSPHLYIRRPSPTTAEFTVTTCPPLTIPLRLLLLALFLLRATLFAAAVLALYSRFFAPAAAAVAGNDDQLLPLLLAGDIPQFVGRLLQAAHLSPAGALLADLVAAAPAWTIGLAAPSAAYLALCFQLHRTESVLVLRGLGIQTTRSLGGLFGWGQETRFIPTEMIRDVLINEAFRGFEVRYYLIVVVEGEADVVVLFPGLLPRRKIVEAVWRGVRGCLFEGPEGVGGREKG
ncbi:Phosphatidylinositol N-acetylglucosaminyltransferase subunit gpi15 [Madurella mycetomatis]|uniref:Phosphatidylinositol N-acetylglucosaminyltransferase subunit gpi15 n=1 Tax=Madurella mycetomatis TaxID=100816 RepID=A0A175W1T2_9PEZI|nr:Phosphatidylinositol N-acetylglucosaminyltransferase subunit gpi15 [Madurella mycetomatis]